MQLTALLALLPLLAVSSAHPAQPQLPLAASVISGPAITSSSAGTIVHTVDESILSALAQHDDPVDALLSLHPELEAQLAEARYLRLIPQAGEEKEAAEAMREGMWMTEGDKLRLRREGRKFMDLTDHMGLLSVNKPGQFVPGFQPAGRNGSNVDPPHLPELKHRRWISPLLAQVKPSRIWEDLAQFSSFYSRYYHSIHGQRSARWLHDKIADIIATSPQGTHISLEYHPHIFTQPSVVARFEPAVRNSSLPLTIVGAHQDSANYLFPLLPAPGADDDGSGSMTILETFRILAQSGYIPERGPVEFQWMAAEEAGLLGSLELARYRRELNVSIGAMIEFDMTAYIRANVTEGVYLIETEANPPLTKWVAGVVTEYCDIPPFIVSMEGSGAGSDYMSYTQYGYPSVFASEGSIENMSPMLHTTRDLMDLDDENGRMSADHAAQFAKLGIAYVIEQAGWSTRYTRAGDNERDRKQW